MTQPEIQAALDALNDEQQRLQRHNTVSDAFGIGDLDVVGLAARAVREKRLVEVARERAALVPAAEPTPVEPTVTAEVLVQRTRCSILSGALPVQVRVQNDSPEPVTVVALTLHASPAGGCVPSIAEHYLTPKVIEPGAELHLPAAIAFHSSGAYQVGARVELKGSAVVDAVPCTLTALPLLRPVA